MTLRLPRPFLVAVALLPALALAEPGPGLSKEDAQLLWEEAVRTHDGIAYTFMVYGFDTEAAAREGCAGYPPCKAARQKMKQVLHLPEMPMAHRERLAALQEGELTPPLPAPDGDRFLVYEGKGRAAGDFVKSTRDPWDYLKAFAPAALPTPEALRTDPDLKARSVLNRVRSAEDLAKALESKQVAVAQLDRRLSNGFTPLSYAVLRGDKALAARLLEAGASPDACGFTTCPLELAIDLQAAELIDLLLSRKASPDGRPEATLSPLMQAGAAKDRALAQRLLDAGADPLQSRAVFIGVRWPRSSLFYARGKDPAFLDWYAPIFQQAVARTGKYGWDAWVEQDGTRTRIADRGTITLQRRPFRVVFTAGEGVPFRVSASDSPEFVAATGAVAVRMDALSPMKVAAIDPEDRYLVIWKLEGGVKADGRVDAGSTEWSVRPDPKDGNGTVRRPGKGGPEYVHEVASLVVGGETVPLEKYAGGPIHLLLGTLPPLGDGTDLFEPRRVTLELKAGKPARPAAGPAAKKEGKK